MMNAWTHHAALSCAPYSVPRADEVGMHTQPANEFFMGRTGQGLHRTFLGEWRFGPGEVFFFPRGQLHEHEPLHGPCSGWTVRIRDEAFSSHDAAERQVLAELDALRRDAYSGENRLILTPQEAARLRGLFRVAVDECAAGRAMSLAALKGMAMDIMVFLGRRTHVQRSAVRQVHPGILAALSWLDAHATEPVRVGDVAARAHLGRSRFHELFLQTTGVPLVEYVTRLRVGRAVLLLTGTDHPILRVCAEVGFGSAGRMYEAFRRYRNRTPASYRRSFGRR